MSQITTHVLDISIGKPVRGLPVVLELEKPDGHWNELSRATTDGDGRIKNLLAPGELAAGTYRLTFETGSYFSARNVPSLYPRIIIAFEVRNPNERHHIPLLLSPHGYSTYRGS